MSLFSSLTPVLIYSQCFVFICRLVTNFLQTVGFRISVFNCWADSRASWYTYLFFLVSRQSPAAFRSSERILSGGLQIHGG